MSFRILRLNCIKMLTPYLSIFLLLVKFEFVGGQAFICIHKDISNGSLQLNCAVDKLTANIDFKFPNKTLGFAYCIAPTPLTKETGPECYCECKSTSSCKCIITQDIYTNTTTLEIKDIDLIAMVGKFTCEHGTYSKAISVEKSDLISIVGGFIDGKEYMCMEKVIKDGVLQLNCTVGRITSTIKFKYPNENFGFAFCKAPTDLTADNSPICSCECNATSTCKCNITQDILKRTTTLMIVDSELTKMLGAFTCEHGPYSKSIEVDNLNIDLREGKRYNMILEFHV